MVHRSRRALTTIVAGVLILITLITNVILFVFIQQDAKNRVRDNIEAKTLTALYALEPNIPPKEFSELVATKQTSHPAYEALRSYMALVKQRAGFKYLYTLAKDPSGTLIYVIDGGDPKSEGFSKLGDKATTDEFRGYREVMASGKPRVDVSKSKEWGHIMSIYYPLKNANGHVIGVIGADHEMQSVYDAIAKRTRFFALLIALITLLGLTATVLAAIIIRRTERNRLKTHENLEKSYDALAKSKKALAKAEETKRALFNASTESVLLLDSAGTILVANKAMAEHFGTVPKKLTGRLLKELKGDEAEAIERMSQKVVEAREVEHCERREGEKYLTYSLYPVMEEDRVVEVAVFAQDIGWRQKLENALRESEERFRSAFENAAVGIALSDLSGTLLKVNRSFCEMLETSEGQAQEMTLDLITHPDDAEKDTDLKKRLLAGEIPYYHVEKRFLGVSGKTIWGILSASAVMDSEGTPLYAIGMIQDITQRKLVELELKLAKMEAEEARERAEHMARTDYLTGLLNRRAFVERFEVEMARVSRDQKPIGLIMADVDHFKKVNDTYGHDAGDEVLKAFAECLERNCRKYDFVGRQGGEEFLIALPESNMEQTMQIAERVRASVEGLRIEAEGVEKPIMITASFGASLYHLKRETLEDVVIRSDQALYEAKTGGRNRVKKKV